MITLDKGLDSKIYYTTYFLPSKIELKIGK